MKLIAIAALTARDGVIGKDGRLPWSLSEDLRRFKRETAGHAVIMGRKTWESLPVKPLPHRLNIVVSSNSVEGALHAESLERAILTAQAFGHDKAFIIGGAQLYKAALPLCDEALLTLVDACVEGDTFFRADLSGMELVSSETFPKDARNEHNMVFQRWTRLPLED